LSKRKSVRIAVLVAGVAAVSITAYGVRFQHAMQAFAADASDQGPQVSNRNAKTDRLAAFARNSVASADINASFALASGPASADAVTETPAKAVAVLPAPEVAPAPTPAGPKHAALTPPAREPAPAAAPPSPPKPKHASQPPTGNVLDDHQIAGLRGRLRLTSDQIEYWPAVESALRDVVRTQFHRGKPSIDVNSPEVQKLIWAAMPLLMRLRDDQKSEVRRLARVIGLEQVASQI
jgi:outer membrane biosynthesis protein TonB